MHVAGFLCCALAQHKNLDAQLAERKVPLRGPLARKEVRNRTSYLHGALAQHKSKMQLAEREIIAAQYRSRAKINFFQILKIFVDWKKVL